LAEIARFSPKEAEAYEESLKSYRDLKNSLDTAREEGIIQGRKEGREEGRQEGREEGRQEGREEGIELVLKVIDLSKSGKNIDEIASQVGISKERVTEILRKIK
jgi:predicted transposase YdaD